MTTQQTRRSIVAFIGTGIIVATFLGLAVRRFIDAGGAQVDTHVDTEPAQKTAEREPATAETAARRGPPRFVDPPPHHLALLRRTAANSAWQASRRAGTRLSTSDLYESEKRDEPWATKMESALIDRFKTTSSVLEKIGATIADIDCRQSSCAFALEFPEESLKQNRETGYFGSREGPLDVLIKETGPLGFVIFDKPVAPIRSVDGRTILGMKVYVIFGENDSDPAGYAAWVSSAREERLKRIAQSSKGQ